MALIKYSDLIPEVVAKVDASDPVTESAIRRAVIEFCARSWVWKYMPDPSNIDAGINTYDVEKDIGAEVAMVISVTVDGQKIDPTSPEWLDANVRDWRTATGQAKYFTQLDTDQLVLVAVPQASIANGLSLIVALQPDFASKSFPKWIATKYLDTIVNGAMSRILLMQGQAWSNHAAGLEFQSRFNSGIADAREDGVSGLSRSTTRTASMH